MGENKTKHMEENGRKETSGRKRNRKDKGKKQKKSAACEKK